MKKMIALLFVIILIALISCHTAETKKDAKTDSTIVKVDSCKTPISVIKK
jgi:uncharacterized membrane protein